MNRTEVDAFETLTGQVQGLYDDMQTLVKKKPGDGVNRFKLGLANSLLRRANELLGKTRKPFADFAEFDEDSLPSNSDVLVVLAQYLSCLEKIRTDNITISGGHWYWVIDDEKSIIRTGAPHKLTK